MFLLLPILIVISSGLTIFITTYVKNLEIFKVLTPIVQFIIHMTPYVFTWIMFIALYIFMPNTKVRFKYTIIPGILAGTTFQIFQFIYVNSNSAFEIGSLVLMDYTDLCKFVDHGVDFRSICLCLVLVSGIPQVADCVPCSLCIIFIMQPASFALASTLVC